MITEFKKYKIKRINLIHILPSLNWWIFLSIKITIFLIKLHENLMNYCVTLKNCFLFFVAKSAQTLHAQEQIDHLPFFLPDLAENARLRQLFVHKCYQLCTHFAKLALFKNILAINSSYIGDFEAILWPALIMLSM